MYKIVLIFLCVVYAVSCKRTGHDDFELLLNPPKYKSSKLLWNSDSAFLFSRSEKESRVSKDWYELKIIMPNRTTISYIYYHIDMYYRGIKNDTLLLQDIKAETNMHIINGWYMFDSKKSRFAPIDHIFPELDSIEKSNTLKLMSLLNTPKRGIFVIDKNKIIKNIVFEYDNFCVSSILTDSCYDCLYYINISKRKYKYYALNEITRKIQLNKSNTIIPTITKIGIE
jgi:hypothetical protein